MAASQRVGETGVTGTSSQHHHNMPYELLRGLNNPTTTPSFMYHSTPNKEGPAAFDFGELEEAIVLQGVKINNNDEAKASLYAAATLEMFPSWPTRSSLHTPIPIPRGSSRSGEEESGDSGSGVNTFSSRAEGPDSPISTRPSSHLSQPSTQNHQLEIIMASDDSPRTTTGVSQTDHPEAAASKLPTHDKRRGAGSTSDRVLDAKTLRRLAQNREAARKSRLRKKAYVQQLETSRIRLSQLEQELHSARSQGLFLGGGAAVGAGTSSGCWQTHQVF